LLGDRPSRAGRETLVLGPPLARARIVGDARAEAVDQAAVAEVLGEPPEELLLQDERHAGPIIVGAGEPREGVHEDQ
jgi:hypothetical protein